MRWAFIGMWTAGALLAGAGIYGDFHGVWEPVPFATNLLSGLAAFLVGAPTAVLFVQGVSRYIAVRTEREHLRGLLSKSLDGLRSALTHLRTAAGMLASPDQLTPWGEPRPSTFTLPAEISRLSAKPRQRSSSDIDEIKAIVRRWSEDPVIREIAYVAPTVHRHALRLHDEIRPRFIQADLVWPLEAALSSLVEASQTVPVLRPAMRAPKGSQPLVFSFAHIREIVVPGDLRAIGQLEDARRDIVRFISALEDVVRAGDRYLGRRVDSMKLEAPLPPGGAPAT